FGKKVRFVEGAPAPEEKLDARLAHRISHEGIAVVEPDGMAVPNFLFRIGKPLVDELRKSGADLLFAGSLAVVVREDLAGRGVGRSFSPLPSVATDLPALRDERCGVLRATGLLSRCHVTPSSARAIVCASRASLALDACSRAWKKV